MERQVVAYKHYFLDFYNDQTDEVQRKIEWTLSLIKTTQHVPKKYFDHMTGTKGLFEIRVEVGEIFSHLLILRQRKFGCTRKWLSEKISKNTKIKN